LKTSLAISFIVPIQDPLFKTLFISKKSQDYSQYPKWDFVQFNKFDFG